MSNALKENVRKRVKRSISALDTSCGERGGKRGGTASSRDDEKLVKERRRHVVATSGRGIATRSSQMVAKTRGFKKLIFIEKRARWDCYPSYR